MSPALAARVEAALAYALGQTLGSALKPKVHAGIEDKHDVEAVAALQALRQELSRA